MSRRLDTAGNAAYSALAKLLLPGTATMPAADGVRTTAKLDEVLGWRPDLAPDLLRGINALKKNTAMAEAWARLEADDPPAYAALRLAVLGTYLMQPEAMLALAYSGALSQPVPAGEIPDYLATDLLNPVKGRGDIWRRTDATTAQVE